MVNFNKIDERDFIFINKPLSEKEEKAFSDFLKKRKERTSEKRKLQTVTRTKKQYA
jgi:hypothetical protein